MSGSRCARSVRLLKASEGRHIVAAIDEEQRLSDPAAPAICIALRDRVWLDLQLSSAVSGLDSS